MIGSRGTWQVAVRPLLAGLLLIVLLMLAAYSVWNGREPRSAAPPADGRSLIGINLFGLANFNRQQVFTNLIAQSEWFVTTGSGWTAMPPAQLDRHGWVRFLAPGQTAPRPLTLPPAPFRPTRVICRFQGSGQFTAGGVARIEEAGQGQLRLALTPTGAEGEGAWIELSQTEPDDPVRDIDCREQGRPVAERFHPEFINFLSGFRTLRFLDWQRINDNHAVRWAARSLPQSASQVGVEGASIEDMVDLANLTGTDPWFLMPYRADDAYIRNFAQLVHARLNPARRVHVELGNEVWNDMFEATRQAQREGMLLKLGNGDPGQAGAIRYVQKACRAMRIWRDVFADRAEELVRVAASHNVRPELAEVILTEGRGCFDALATAPYIWLDLKGMDQGARDAIFARMPDAINETIDFADQNRAIALRHGLRFIAYEGGQHLVTPNLVLARALQRDARMGQVYRAYLERWDQRIRSDLILYASTAPIGDYGSWGLREYAGQPMGETPKLAAVRTFIAERAR